MGLSERWSQAVETVHEDGLHGGGGGVTVVVLTTYVVLHISKYCFFLLSPQGTARSKMPISSLPLGSGLRPGYRLEAKEIIYTNIRGARVNQTAKN